MELSIRNRIALLQILPKEGDFRTLKYLRAFKEDLSLSEQEQEDISMRHDAGTGMLTWDGNKALKMDREFDIKKPIANIILEILDDLDKQKKLNDETFNLYEKFIVSDEGEEV